MRYNVSFLVLSVMLGAAPVGAQVHQRDLYPDQGSESLGPIHATKHPDGSVEIRGQGTLEAGQSEAVEIGPVDFDKGPTMPRP